MLTTGCPNTHLGRSVTRAVRPVHLVAQPVAVEVEFAGKSHTAQVLAGVPDTVGVGVRLASARVLQLRGWRGCLAPKSPQLATASLESRRNSAVSPILNG